MSYSRAGIFRQKEWWWERTSNYHLIGMDFQLKKIQEMGCDDGSQQCELHTET
jgi:hypothetical protein